MIIVIIYYLINYIFLKYKDNYIYKKTVINFYNVIVIVYK